MGLISANQEIGRHVLVERIAQKGDELPDFGIKRFYTEIAQAIEMTIDNRRVFSKCGIFQIQRPGRPPDPGLP